MLPYRIETLYQHDPWANWTLFGTTIAISLAIELGLIPPEVVEQIFVLGSGSPVALVGHLFAHAGLAHLVGNMVFLWVFGNAVCATVGNLAYFALYLSLGAFAGLIHLMVSGAPVVGASGAITGVVGLAVAFYPINRVNVLFSLGFLTRTIRVRLWGLALYWTAWDILGAWLGLDNVAYWGHLGGTAAGLAVGLALLAGGQVQLTEFDNGSLLDLLLRRKPPHQARPSADAAFAQVQAAARAFRESLETEASTPPEQARAPLRLRLRAEGTPIPAEPPQPHQTPSTPLPVRGGGQARIQLGAGRPPTPLSPAPGSPAPASLGQPTTAWPATLPEGRYFVFDGDTRLGPIARIDFLERLSCALDTSRWWFWVAGMEEWHRVSDLNRHGGIDARTATPAVPARAS